MVASDGDTIRSVRAFLRIAPVAGLAALAAAAASCRSPVEERSLAGLRSSDPAERAAAIRILVTIRSARAAPELAEILRHDGEPALSEAKDALKGIGRPAVPALVAALHDDRQEEALEVLGGIGPDAAGALPVLLEQLQTEEFHFRSGLGTGMSPGSLWCYLSRCLGKAIARIGPRNSRVASAFVEALRIPDADAGCDWIVEIDCQNYAGCR